MAIVRRTQLTLRRRARRVEVFAQTRDQRARSTLSASTADCLLQTKRKRQRWHSVQMSRAEAACAAAQASCTHGRMRRILDRVLARYSPGALRGGWQECARGFAGVAGPASHARARERGVNGSHTTRSSRSALALSARHWPRSGLSGPSQKARARKKVRVPAANLRMLHCMLPEISPEIR